jgi:putative pyoverdin transport system ATP-binding/permease protein
MKLLRFLMRGSWGTVLLGSALSLLAGASNAGLLVLINAALHDSATSTASLVGGFIGIGFTRVLSSGMSEFLLARFAYKTTAELRRDLCCRALNTPLRQFEQIGIPKLMVTLTEDINAVSRALRVIQAVIVNIAMMAGAIVYLGWLSWPALVMMIAVTGLGILCQGGLLKRAFQALRQAREEENNLFQHFRAMTEGIKELRIHKLRREAFLSKKIHDSTSALQNHHVESAKRVVFASASNQLFFIISVGAVLVFLPTLKTIPTEVLTGYVLTILYLMSPLHGLIKTFPAFGRAEIALERIDRLGLSLSQTVSEGGPVAPITRPWRQLELRNVEFCYPQHGRDRDFILGPIDFVLHPGEILFIVGGNGSGKSTLAKLVLGLYNPEDGEIRLDGQPITDQNREWYRQHFSVIFSDFHLFEDLMGLECPSLDQRARDYLSLLQLEHKVQVQNGGLSTTALSQGQRRRLALLTAYLEDRPIYVFDEWAADQDPQYKKVFYTQLLPELKARGKGVIVITHDDRYFDLADRIFKLDYGKRIMQSEIPTGVFVGGCDQYRKLAP